MQVTLLGVSVRPALNVDLTALTGETIRLAGTVSSGKEEAGVVSPSPSPSAAPSASEGPVSTPSADPGSSAKLG